MKLSREGGAMEPCNAISNLKKGLGSIPQMGLKKDTAAL